MLTVAVVDALAESRIRLSSEINRTFSQPGSDFHLLPRISIVPLALQELKFHARPNVVIVGPGLIEREITTVAAIRAQLPEARILALVPTERNRIGAIEHLIRLGADDVVDAQASGRELLTRLVLLARRVERKQCGKLLLVEGVKGGVGATAIVAGFAELLAKESKSVVVVDGDCVNRGLSRYLRARPLINENLQLILDGLRASTAEFVAQAKCAVGVSNFEIGCVPPVTDDEKMHNPDGAWIRHFMSTIEALDEASDYVIVDIARFSGALRETLYRAADGVVFVASQDPACLPALIDRVKSAKGILSPETPIVVVRNERERDGISSGVWQRELQRISDVENVNIAQRAIPYSSAASRWPVSGFTIASLGTKQLVEALEAALASVTGEGSLASRSSEWRAVITQANSTIKTFIARLRPSPKGLRDNPELDVAKTLPPPEPQSPISAVPQLDFFVSAPNFSSDEKLAASSPKFEVSAKEDLLVSPARLTAA